MLKKVLNIDFLLEEKDNTFEKYEKEISSYWDQFVQKKNDVLNEDVLSVSNIEEVNDDLRIIIHWIKYSDVIYSKMVGNVKTRSLFSGGYVVTRDNYICFAVDKNDTINLIGGMASKKDLENSIYNPDMCIVREFKEEIGLDITDDRFVFNIKYLKCPNEKEDEKAYYPVGLIYEIKTDYTKQELNDLFSVMEHDSELKFLIFLKKNEHSKLDGYAKKDYIDSLYNLIEIDV